MLEMTNRATGTEAERKQQAEGVELDARGQRGDLRKLESAWTPTDRPRERRHAGEVGGCEAVPCFCKGGGSTLGWDVPTTPFSLMDSRGEDLSLDSTHRNKTPNVISGIFQNPKREKGKITLKIEISSSKHYDSSYS